MNFIIRNLLLAFLVFSGQTLLAQRNSSTDKSLITTSLTLKLRSTDTDRDSIKKQISKRLFSDASKQVVSRIQNETRDNSAGDIRYYSPEFVEKVITSANPDIRFNTADNKEITGTLSFSKRSFASTYFDILKIKTDSIKPFIDIPIATKNVAYETEKKNMELLRNSAADIQTIYKVVEIFDESLLSSAPQLQSDLNQIRFAANSGVSQNESDRFQKKYLQILLYRQNNDYNAAIKELNDLQAAHPSHDRLSKLRSVLFDEIEATQKDQLNQADPLKVIESIEYLEKADPYFQSKYKAQKAQLQGQIFRQSMILARSQYEAGEYTKAEATLLNIQSFAAPDQTEFASLLTDIKRANAKKSLDYTESLISDKEFYKANQVLRTSKSICVTTEDQRRWDVLKKRTIEKAVDHELNKQKNLYPFTWQLQVGGGIYNFTTPDALTGTSNISDVLLTPVPYFVFGIYKKLNVQKPQAGKPAIGSNLLGLKLAWGIPSLNRKTNFDHPLTPVFYSSFVEPQISLFFLRFIDISAGKIFQLTDINKKTIPLNSYYVGIKPRIRNLHLNLGVKYLTDGKDAEFISLTGGAQLSLNFKRKISRETKNTVRSLTEARFKW